jgi:preprotein translocase subunit SecD
MGRRILPAIGLLLVLVTAASPGVAFSYAQASRGGAHQKTRPPGTRLGLDFAKPLTSAVSESDIASAIRILRRRLAGLGITEGRVERSRVTGEAIYVELPPSADVDHVASILIANADLEVRLQAKGTETYKTKQEAENVARTQSGGSARHQVSFYRGHQGNDGFAKEGWVIIENDVVISGKEINDATAAPSSTGNAQNYEIRFSLSPSAAERFGEITG